MDRKTVPEIAALWERFKGTVMERTAVLELARRSLQQGELDGDLRLLARREAHILAGSLGSFGFVEGTRLAREIEYALDDATTLDDAACHRVATMVTDLQRELARPYGDGDLSDAPASEGQPYLVIVAGDPVVAAQLEEEAVALQMLTSSVSTPDQARDAMARRQADAVLLSLDFTGHLEDGLALLSDLAHRMPPVPVFVVSATDSLAQRVQVATLGARGFLPATLPPAAMVSVVNHAVGGARSATGKILAVDDDPAVLAVIRALLEPIGVRLTTLRDPIEFWKALPHDVPDLVILDMDMPGIGGLELCRVLRNDTRWSALPIVILSRQSDARTIRRVFAAGGDDFATKPIVGMEFVTRVINRMERAQLYRRAADHTLGDF